MKINVAASSRETKRKRSARNYFTLRISVVTRRDSIFECRFAPVHYSVRSILRFVRAVLTNIRMTPKSGPPEKQDQNYLD